MVITFYGRLPNGDTPQLPCKHRTNSQTHHNTQKVDDGEEDGGHPIVPGVLERLYVRILDLS